MICGPVVSFNEHSTLHRIAWALRQTGTSKWTHTSAVCVCPFVCPCLSQCSSNPMCASPTRSDSNACQALYIHLAMCCSCVSLLSVWCCTKYDHHSAVSHLKAFQLNGRRVLNGIACVKECKQTWLTLFSLNELPQAFYLALFSNEKYQVFDLIFEGSFLSNLMLKFSLFEHP